VTDAIFLSAGVPDPRRGPEYAKTADTVAIAAAVGALVHVTLGRRVLVWGGHPAITPMIWVMAEEMGVDYAAWVKLYQSLHFKDEFPDDNKRFQNVTFTEAVDGDLKKSLLAMRTAMFKENRFSSAVFIGGMGGIVDEFELLRGLQPDTKPLPILSTGGAALDVGKRLSGLPDDLTNDLDYVTLFHRYLGISETEDRYPRPPEKNDDPPPNG
jgi:hypothetical protein